MKQAYQVDLNITGGIGAVSVSGRLYGGWGSERISASAGDVPGAVELLLSLVGRQIDLLAPEVEEAEKVGVIVGGGGPQQDWEKR